MTQPNPQTGSTGQQTQQGGQQQSPPAQQSGQPLQGDPNTPDTGQQQGQQGQQHATDPATDARLSALFGTGQQGQGQQGEQNAGTGQGQQQGQQQGHGDDLRSWLTEQLAAQRQSISDSVRNSVLNEMRRTGQAPAGNDTGQQGQGQQQQQQSAPQRPAGPDPMDLREGRMAFTQYIGDTRTFTSPDERALANTVGGQLVAQEIAGGATPDAAARKAATEVASQLDGFVQAIENRTKNWLRERGQLKETDPSQPAGTNSPPSNLETKRQAAIDLAKQYNPTGQQAG